MSISMSIACKIMARLRPAKFEPGDYREENTLAILGARKMYGAIFDLWQSEADEARHPIRKIEAQELADAAKAMQQRSINFYSKWELRK